MLLPLLIAAQANAPSDPLVRFECARCHEGIGEPVRLESHCTRCHEAIRAGTWNAPTELMDEWRPNLVSLREVPSLANLAGFRREWIASFLERPIDVRPNLRGMMPRFPIRRAEAEAIAARLAPASAGEAPVFAPQAIASGRRLFTDLACGACHAFSGAVDPAKEPALGELGTASRARLLAPDLRHTRDRLVPSFVARFIVDPTQARPGADMPSFDLDRAEADALAAFILGAPLSPIAVPAEEARLPLLDRKVTFDEVRRRVFGTACQHCHANPERSFGDGGPGNTGGFGYAGKGLSLASYREVMSGSRSEEGRISIFRRDEGGTPKIIAHVLARRREVRGETVEGVLGMPMGLPPLSPEQIQLLETWIAQGRPE